MRYSIIIPCLNRPDQLQTALRSCLDQTFGDFEVIVVDDGSSPPLSACCDEFGDPRIRYLANPTNLGAAHSRNSGLAEARGDYVSFLDSDDVYTSDRLARLEAALAERPSQLVFHLQQRVFVANGDSEIGQAMPSRIPAEGERLDEFMLLNGDYIQTNSYVIARDLAQRFTFDPTSPAWEDNKYLLQSWLACDDYLAVNAVLSRYHDERRSGRLSKQRDPARHTPFLAFVREHCSTRATAGLEALVAAETPLFKHPAQVLGALVRGRRAGVSFARCGIYLLRSIIGFARVEAIIYSLRELRRGARSPTSIAEQPAH